ncbi:hypothetical protein [Insolitispirillum peregrinum]|uniref:Uncharacterized protein n=1 Tax=Insolitispirillum peregrinum TaxID=80876 RepID=A0A1N7MTP9_9PROT|nr:hypothetical protein [Insolitispirillum peregrinum]SIS89422.1 hypothetical protein SAMN05421779_104344 [Insolitispirillum peregrinum]
MRTVQSPDVTNPTGIVPALDTEKEKEESLQDFFRRWIENHRDNSSIYKILDNIDSDISLEIWNAYFNKIFIHEIILNKIIENDAFFEDINFYKEQKNYHNKSDVNNEINKILNYYLNTYLSNYLWNDVHLYLDKVYSNNNNLDGIKDEAGNDGSWSAEQDEERSSSGVRKDHIFFVCLDVTDFKHSLDSTRIDTSIINGVAKVFWRPAIQFLGNDSRVLHCSSQENEDNLKFSVRLELSNGLRELCLLIHNLVVRLRNHFDSFLPVYGWHSIRFRSSVSAAGIDLSEKGSPSGPAVDWATKIIKEKRLFLRDKPCHHQMECEKILCQKDKISDNIDSVSYTPIIFDEIAHDKIISTEYEMHKLCENRKITGNSRCIYII